MLGAVGTAPRTCQGHLLGMPLHCLSVCLTSSSIHSFSLNASEHTADQVTHKTGGTKRPGRMGRGPGVRRPTVDATTGHTVLAGSTHPSAILVLL